MFKLTIKTTNAAFDGTYAQREETARILRNAATRVALGDTEGSLRDVDGNTVGSFGLVEDGEE